jgi:hypothetical protein
VNSATILAILEDEPERLFKVQEHLRTDYLALAMFWHPDKNKDAKANDVLAHINLLYKRAQEHVEKGIWHVPGVLELESRDNKKFKIKYLVKRKFELGEMFIGQSIVTFLIARSQEDMVINGLRMIGSIRYPTEDFKKSLLPHMPNVVKSFETQDHWVICVRKEPHEVLLLDLIKYSKGAIDAKHVAWIISSLLNLACFLQIGDMTHNGITLNTVFVSPTKHAVSLYGGWWYAQYAGKLIKHLPPELYPLASRRLKEHKIAQSLLDLDSIKAIGRACLGDISGGGLRGRKDVPAPFVQFLQLPSSKTAVEQYKEWPKVLEDSFGPRRYQELKITGDDVYQQGES